LLDHESKHTEIRSPLLQPWFQPAKKRAEKQHSNASYYLRSPHPHTKKKERKKEKGEKAKLSESYVNTVAYFSLALSRLGLLCKIYNSTGAFPGER